MLERRLDRDDVYHMLREALLEYSDREKSAEMEIFAVEMEVAPGQSDSADPALLDEFNKGFPERVSLREGLSKAADYVDRELVRLRHVDEARTVVSDLRAAADHPEAPSNILRRLFDCTGG